MNNLELTRTLYDAFNRGDVETIVSWMDPAVEWREAEGNPYRVDGSAWIGPEAIVNEFFARLGSDWDALGVNVESLRDAGDHVVMQGRGVGTYKATGKRMDAQACHVLRFANGKLVAFQQYCDTAQLQSVMRR